jgi:hypothetical protein
MASWWHRLEQWLLWVDVPGDAALTGVESSVRNTWAVSLTLLFVAISAAIVLALYYFESQRLGLVRRLFLAGVRTAVVGVLFFLLFRPLLLVAVFKGERPRGVALMLDNTQSMTQKDRRLSAADKVRVALAMNLVPLNADLKDVTKLPSTVPERPSRLELVRDVLAHPELNLRKNLEKLGPMRTFVFGTRVHRVVEEKGADTLADALKGDDPRTALADCINEVLLRGDGDLPAAIVLMTDGGDNASKTPLLEVARECQRLGVPLHIYGVGSAEAGTLQLRDVAVPEIIFADDTVAVPVRWKALGMKGGKIEIVATLGGKEVAHKEVAATDGDDLRETLTFTPPKGQSKDERLDLTTTIRLKGSNDFSDEIKKPTRLVDRKIKLLYVENAPRWEYKFLQMNLVRDVRVEPSYLLVHGDEKALSSGPPFLAAFPATRKELFAYDLIILGDVPASFLGHERMQWIADFVKEGGGLIHIAGQQYAPSSWHGTPLETLLPIEFEPMRFNVASSDVRPQVFQPVLTAAGERHELMSLADTREENLRIWRELPGLYWHYPVNKLRPGAYSLLVHSTEKCRNSDELMPIVSLQYSGKGLVVCLTTDETWRWRFNTQDRLFSRFWGQAIYLAGLSHTLGSKQTQLMLDRSEIVLGRPIQVFARIFDVNFQPLVQKSVTAKLDYLDAAPGDSRVQTVELLPVNGQPGEYRATLPNDRVGRFALRTLAADNASLEYRVLLPAQHELAVMGLAKDALEEAARASGGAFYREEDLNKLADKAKPQTAPFTVRQPVMPLNPLAFLLFVVLITVEWVVRKFSNLS